MLRPSPDKSLRPTKVGQIFRQLLYRLRGNPAIKLKRFLPLFVQERFRTEHRVMRQAAAAEDDRCSAEKAIFSDVDRLRRLPAPFQVDAVGDELRTKSRDRAKSTDPHARRAINEVPAADAGLALHDQLRP